MTESLVDTERAAEILDLKPQTLNNWRSLGRGPNFIKQGRKVSYDVQDLEEWKQRNKRRNTNEVGKWA